MDTNNKMAVLMAIKSHFTCHNIVWAVGGSFMLYQKKLVKEYSDLDIIVSNDEYLGAYNYLKSVGKEVEVKVEEPYHSDNYSSFIIDGVYIDLISSFCIKYEDRLYLYDFSSKAIEISGGIPLCRLEDWKLLYKYMGRQNKVELINSWMLDKSYNLAIKVLDTV